MDKFGIFKLLNSFLGSNNSKNDADQNQSPTTQNDLSGFLSAFDNFNKASAPPKKVEKTPPPPLQASMLSTMNSHDEFIKRVKEKHPTNH